MGQLFFMRSISKMYFCGMDVEGFIGSGMIETYCLGFTSPEETKMVEKMAQQYPAVKEEIVRIRQTFSAVISAPEIQPSAGVKQSLMRRIYKQQAIVQKEFLPLLNEDVSFNTIVETVKANNIAADTLGDQAYLLKVLPSTREVINLAAWVRTEHGEELHADMNEYIAVITGSCDMYFDGVKKSYKAGDIMHIPPHVVHSAVITSEVPMFAIVQRQMIV
ncbi:MAG: cupin domain-containing protein [Pedobacter sp.]|nr:MAG: cupin domain-containing protein [Pedobacter sp.]